MNSVSSMGSMGLSSLMHEPARLKNEADKCNDELEALVMANYRVFVENLTCSVDLRSEDIRLGKVSSELGELITKLAGSCSGFRERVSVLVSSHKRNRKTLQHHMQLVELLEVPQLVEACTRNGFYDEALELANFVNGLERRYLLSEGLKAVGKAEADGQLQIAPATTLKGTETETGRYGNGVPAESPNGPGDGVIASIVGEVRRTLFLLRAQLLTQLSQHSSLPKALSVLSSLRKLDSLLVDQQLTWIRHAGPSVEDMTEAQRELLRARLGRACSTRLQMEWLEARTVWMMRGGASSESGAEEKVESKAVADTMPGSPRTLSTSASASANQTSPGFGIAPSSASANSQPVSALGPYGKAIELLESSRTAWFSVVTQFKALFGDENGPHNGIVAAVAATAHGGNDARRSEENVSLPPSAILSSWVSAQVTHLLADLEKLCHEIEDGAALRAVLEQGIFCGHRLAPVGCNFNAALIPIFERLVVGRISRQWDASLVQVKRILETERFNALQSVSDSPSGDRDRDRDRDAAKDKQAAAREQVVPLYVRQNTKEADMTRELLTPLPANKRSSASAAAAAAGEVPAPKDVSYFPPLAFWMNTLLASLNLLRDCPLASARGPIAEKLQSILTAFCEHLVAVCGHLRAKGAKYFSAGTGTGTGGASDKEVSESLDRLYARSIVQDIIPHSLACFDSIFDQKPGGAYNSTAGPAASAAQGKADAAVSVSETPVKAGASSHSTAASAAGAGVSSQRTVLGTLHVNRLMDAQSVLSKESFQTLQLCWAVFSNAGLVADAPFTPSPVPVRK